MNTAERRRRAVLGMVLMGATAAAAAWATPRRLMAQYRPMPKLDELVPEQLGLWTTRRVGVRQLVSPDVQAVLDTLYQQSLSRIYGHPLQESVMLAMAYGGDQSDATRAHRPEVCYPAQGFSIDGVHKASLTVTRTPHGEIPVRRMVARLGSRTEVVTYWITVGTRIATSASEQKLSQLAYGLRGVVPDGLLVRVSTLGTDATQAWRTHEAFATALWDALRPDQRDRVFGGTALGGTSP